MNTTRLSLAVEQTARLVREIRNQNAKVRTAVSNRMNHPSFGVTKTYLNTEYMRLVGMCEAWLYVTEVWDHAGMILWDHNTRQVIYVATGVDLDSLETAINHC